jgi:hypothetical protein
MRIALAQGNSTQQNKKPSHSPEPAGIRAPHLSLQSVDWISRAFSGPLSLPRKGRAQLKRQGSEAAERQSERAQVARAGIIPFLP